LPMIEPQLWRQSARPLSDPLCATAAFVCGPKMLSTFKA
jgi:hypothetical protein